MAAQGYQESQLDQNAKSSVGAIGVMQLMPATGKDMKVGDVNQVEANIHAGIKYMRWMIDHYYGDEPMTELDKALFTFASYNAGAGRVSQLRKEAAKRGLDPNVWFQNVEYVAAEKVGAGNGHLRQQHLQVLHRLPIGPGEPRRTGKSGRKHQEWRSVKIRRLRPCARLAPPGPTIAIHCRRSQSGDQSDRRPGHS